MPGAGRSSSLLLTLSVLGCGPQVAVDDPTGAGTEGSSGSASADTTVGDPTSAGSTGGDSAGSTGADATGDTGDTTQAWCAQVRSIEDHGGPHVLDLDGGLPEVWSENREDDPVTGEPVTRYVVQRFDGETLVVIDEITRPGYLRTFGDVDGDGIDDVVHALGDTGVWFKGRSDGTIAAEGLPFALEDLSEPKYGDFDGDGILDVLAWSPDPEHDSEIDVRLGDGNGGWVLAGSFDTQIDYVIFDAHPLGDRRVLLIAWPMCPGFCMYEHETIVIELAKDGSPSERARIVTDEPIVLVDAIDRTGDALPDLLLARLDHSYDTTRFAWYDSPEYAALDQLDSPVLIEAAADVDQDGTMDIIERAVSDQPMTVRFGLLGEGLGPALPILGTEDDNPSLWEPTVADFDGDGWLDFVISSEPDGKALWSVVPCMD